MANKIRNIDMTFDEILNDEVTTGGYTPPEVSRAEAEQAFEQMFSESTAALNKMLEVRK